jgi:hypothetical protein
MLERDCMDHRPRIFTIRFVALAWVPTFERDPPAYQKPPETWKPAFRNPAKLNISELKRMSLL